MTLPASDHLNRRRVLKSLAAIPVIPALQGATATQAQTAAKAPGSSHSDRHRIGAGRVDDPAYEGCERAAAQGLRKRLRVGHNASPTRLDASAVRPHFRPRQDLRRRSRRVPQGEATRMEIRARRLEPNAGSSASRPAGRQEQGSITRPSDAYVLRANQIETCHLVGSSATQQAAIQTRRGQGAGFQNRGAGRVRDQPGRQSETAPGKHIDIYCDFASEV